MFPKEHGAYGQMALPLATALLAVTPTGSALLFALAVVAAFLAHEPGLVLAGRRGPRAYREHGTRAARWLAALGVLALLSGVTAVWLAPAGSRWSVILPLVPALVVAGLAAAGREKSGAGEVAVAVAFSAAAVPAAIFSGASLREAATVAVPFAVTFVAATLAVRAVILRVRGGGSPAAVLAARSGALALVLASAGVLAAASLTNMLPWTALAAAVPGLAVAAAVALRPPHPSKLKSLGWTLVAASLLTAAIVLRT